jgi:hypothetical protein
VPKPYVIDDGGKIAKPELINVDYTVDPPTAEVVIRNSHYIWFAVQTLGNQQWVLLPPCELRGEWSLTAPLQTDCTKATASLGTLQLTANNSASLKIDGTGEDPVAAERLFFIYGAEVFWRAALLKPLPYDVATQLEDAAYGLSDAEVQNFGGELGAAGPVSQFVKIGSDVHDANAPALSHDIIDLAQDDALTNWLVSRGLVDTDSMNKFVTAAKGASGALYAVQLGVELGDFPVRFSVESLAATGATSGTLNFYVPDYVAAAAEKVAVDRRSASSTPTKQPGVPTNTPAWTASTSPNGDLWITRVGGGNPKKLVTGPVWHPSLSHDGQHIAYLRQLGADKLSGQQIEVVDIDGSGQRIVIEPRPIPDQLRFGQRTQYQSFGEVRWAFDDAAIYFQWSYGNVSGKGITRHDLRSGAEEDLGLTPVSAFEPLSDNHFADVSYVNACPSQPCQTGDELTLDTPHFARPSITLVEPGQDFSYAASFSGALLAYVTEDKLRVVAADGSLQGVWDAAGRQVQTFTYDDKSVVLSGPGHDQSVIELN